jgi:hypothetical protein
MRSRPPSKGGHCEISNVGSMQAYTSDLRLAETRKRFTIFLARAKMSPDPRHTQGAIRPRAEDESGQQEIATINRRTGIDGVALIGT